MTLRSFYTGGICVYTLYYIVLIVNIFFIQINTIVMVNIFLYKLRDVIYSTSLYDLPSFLFFNDSNKNDIM